MTAPPAASADAAEVQNLLVAKLDKEAAIAIYLAKASRTPGDSRASVDAKVKAAVKEALAQVADALECACCFEPLAPGTAVALECGHTYCNRQACVVGARGAVQHHDEGCARRLESADVDLDDDAVLDAQ
jgi:hypothetical protein